MAEIIPRSPSRKQFCVRFRAEDELIDLKQMASEEGMSVAAFLRWLTVREKERRKRSSRR